MSTRPGLLDGITVADFGWAVAGPVLGRFLAHHGATVIKVESNTRLDATRMSPPFAGRPHRNGSGYFDQHNAGKLSVTFNLKHPDGVALARRLALWADIVNENFARLKGRKIGLVTNHTGRARDGRTTIDLLHQAQGIKVHAVLGHLTPDYLKHARGRHLYRLAGGRDAHQLTLVRPAESEVSGNGVALGNQLVHAHIQVRKSTSKEGHKLASAFITLQRW